MRRNQRHRSWDSYPCCEPESREGVNKLPEKDSASDGVIGRERLDPDHHIGNGDYYPGERHDD